MIGLYVKDKGFYNPDVIKVPNQFDFELMKEMYTGYYLT